MATGQEARYTLHKHWGYSSQTWPTYTRQMMKVNTIGQAMFLSGGQNAYANNKDEFKVMNMYICT